MKVELENREREALKRLLSDGELVQLLEELDTVRVNTMRDEIIDIATCGQPDKERIYEIALRMAERKYGVKYYKTIANEAGIPVD